MENLKKILDLVRKTGDKCIVLPENGDPFVIMDIDTYEDLACEFSGEEMLKNMDLDDLDDDFEDIKDPFEKDIEKDTNSVDEITSLTEEELLDKINRDVSAWKGAQEDVPDKEVKESTDEPDSDENGEEETVEDAGNTDSDQFYIEK